VVFASRRIYFENGCRYKHKKKQAENGELPPDYYAKCINCGSWFPGWLSIDGYQSIPKTCKKEGCIKTVLSLLKLKKVEKPNPFIYSTKEAAKIRQTVCNSLNRPVCKHYLRCLELLIENRKFMQQYFITSGKCYEYPDDWQGVKK